MENFATTAAAPTTAARHFYGWHTTKTTTGFDFIITKITPTAQQQPNGHYCISEVVKRATAPTRATAVADAKKWKRYFTQLTGGDK